MQLLSMSAIVLILLVFLSSLVVFTYGFRAFALVDDATILDTNMHVVVAVGQYVRFWVNVNNTGSSTWNESYRLRFYVDGVLVNESYLNTSVGPGSNITLWVVYSRVNLTPGWHNWSVVMSNGLTDFGEVYSRSVLVVEPPEFNEYLTIRVYATREGLVGGTTSNGHVIKPYDHFVALPSTRALALNNDVYDYYGSGELRVAVLRYGDRVAAAPVWDVGPWNTKDNYWDHVRDNFTDLPWGYPEAEAAYYDGYNNGTDGFGRTVLNPAGIDLGDGVFWHDLNLSTNSWIYVTFLWIPWNWTINPGDRVEVIASALNVRTTPSIRENNLITSVSQGTRGTVVDGPVISNSYIWVKVRYDNGVEGWSAYGKSDYSAIYLRVISRDLKGHNVTVDPGHGGSDSGAVYNTTNTTFYEKDINLNVSLILAEILEDDGMNVVLTRNGDYNVSLSQRVSIANGNNTELFVSIHSNAETTGTASGFEVYYWYYNSTLYSTKGLKLATLIDKELEVRIPLPNRGVKGANFYVLRNTRMPASLVELGFGTNPYDLEILVNPYWQIMYAKSIWIALRRWFNTTSYGQTIDYTRFNNITVEYNASGLYTLTLRVPRNNSTAMTPIKNYNVTVLVGVLEPVNISLLGSLDPFLANAFPSNASFTGIALDIQVSNISRIRWPIKVVITYNGVLNNTIIPYYYRIVAQRTSQGNITYVAEYVPLSTYSVDTAANTITFNITRQEYEASPGIITVLEVIAEPPQPIPEPLIIPLVIVLELIVLVMFFAKLYRSVNKPGYS